MNIKFLIQSIICLLLLVGCKNDNAKNDIKKEEVKESKNSTIVNNNVFMIELKVKLQKDDALEVFYLENESDTYNASQMIQKKIKGNDLWQDISFELPKDIYPSNIRLDFGFNKEQQPIQVDECTMSYNNKSFVIKGKDLKNYFNFNGGIEMLSDSLTFKMKPFDLHGNEVYDPYMVGNKNLETALMTKI